MIFPKNKMVYKIEENVIIHRIHELNKATEPQFNGRAIKRMHSFGWKITANESQREKNQMWWRDEWHSAHPMRLLITIFQVVFFVAIVFNWFPIRLNSLKFCEKKLTIYSHIVAKLAENNYNQSAYVACQHHLHPYHISWDCIIHGFIFSNWPT